MPAGKSEIILRLVDLEQDKIKQPQDPASRYFPEQGAPGLGGRHGQNDPFTAIPALSAAALQVPTGPEHLLCQVSQHIVQQNKDHDKTFKIFHKLGA